MDCRVTLLVVLAILRASSSLNPNTLPTLTYDIEKQEIVGIESLPQLLQELLRNFTSRHFYSLSISTNFIPNQITLNGTIITSSKWDNQMKKKSLQDKLSTQRTTIASSRNSITTVRTRRTTASKQQSIDSLLLDAALPDGLEKRNGKEIFKEYMRDIYATDPTQLSTKLITSTHARSTELSPLNSLIKNFVSSLQQLMNNTPAVPKSSQRNSTIGVPSTQTGLNFREVVQTPPSRSTSTSSTTQVALTADDIGIRTTTLSPVSKKIALLNNNTIELLAAAVADTVKILRGDTYGPTTSELPTIKTTRFPKIKKFAPTEASEKCRRMLKSVIKRLKENLQKRSLDETSLPESYHRKVVRNIHDDIVCSQKLNEYLKQLAFLTAQQLKEQTRSELKRN